MKVTKQYLKKLIKESLEEAQAEGGHDIQSKISIDVKKINPDYFFGQGIPVEEKSYIAYMDKQGNISVKPLQNAKKVKINHKTIAWVEDLEAKEPDRGGHGY